MYIAIKHIYPAVILSTSVVFAGLISISIVYSSEQENAGPANETSSDSNYYSNIINEQQNIVYTRVSGNNISSASSKADGKFVSIFDGKTLNGWKMAGEGRFVIIESDAALQSDKGGGLLWYSEKQYKDFILKLDWKISDEGDNSGVFVRFPDPDDNPNIAVREGYEVQIDNRAGNRIHQTGAIYDFAAPSKIVSKPPGQWNTMEIQTLGQSYTVIINGQKVTEFTGSRTTEGHIGLQAHDDESKVSFKNIMVKEAKP
jgi:3-keto-disaccharide hydrolase